MKNESRFTDLANIEPIFKGFKGSKFDPTRNNSTEIPDEPGNYLICLQANSKLPKVAFNPIYREFEGLKVIYTGISSKSLRTRDYKQHFKNNNSGSSTIRKSLGALFGFMQIPRDKNGINKKTKFKSEDEIVLTQWMTENLVLYFLPNPNFGDIEFFLIQYFNPPLNLRDNYSSINSDFRNLLSKLRTGKFLKS